MYLKFPRPVSLLLCKISWCSRCLLRQAFNLKNKLFLQDAVFENLFAWMDFFINALYKEIMQSNRLKRAFIKSYLAVNVQTKQDIIEIYLWLESYLVLRNILLYGNIILIV